MKEDDIQKKLAKLSPEKRDFLLKELRKRKNKTQPDTPLDTIKPLQGSRDLLPLSFSQQRLWFLDQLEGQNPTYNMPAVLELSGQLNIGALEKALNQIVQRHEILRTEFVTLEGKGYQRVLPHLEYQIDVIRLADEAASSQTRQQLITQEVNRSFDLSCAPLFRCRLIQESNQNWTFVLCLHHIVSDGWSSSILISELSSFYRANVEGNALLGSSLDIQYADYATWQREKLSGEYLEKQLEFWRNELQGLETLEFPTDYRRPPVLTNNGQRKFFPIPDALGSRVEQLSRQLNCTPFNTFLALYCVLIYRYSGQKDFAIGIPVANRTQSSTEPLIGFFINSLAVRARIDPEQSFESLVTQFQQTSQAAIDHQEVPFEKLIDELGVERNRAQSPLFQMMFVFQNTPKSEFDLPALHARFSQVETSTAKFDLTLTLNNDRQRYDGEWEFNTDLFAPQTIDQISQHYLALAQRLTEAPQTAINKVRFLAPQEQEKIVIEWNQNQPIPQPLTGSIHQVFEKNAVAFGSRNALTYEQAVLSYKALNEQANQLAHLLVERGIKKGEFVGLSLDRSLEMVVAILGILKAGAAYVPLDPSSPKDRVQFIIKDAEINVLLVDTQARRAEYSGVEIITLQGESDNLARQPVTNLDLPLSSEAIAYIIYTSGTTGRPKGVLIPHSNVTRLFDATAQAFQFSAQDVWTLFHSYAFDFSVWEIWGALFYGGKLVVVPQWISRSPQDFHQLLVDEKVTVLNQTPSAFSQLVYVDQAQPRCDAFSLRCIVFGGEALDCRSLRTWVDRYGLQTPALINMYGITETTVHVTYQRLSIEHLESGVSNIGRPIADLKVYILDAYQNPVPVGVPGEMYVGGAGVAQGYLNRAALNDEKFVALQLPGTPEQRLYRSGDLARYLPSGEIEYLGRLDSQVKIRGFRIELGEIENTLNVLPEVDESVVRVEASDAGQKSLVAYLIPAGGASESCGSNGIDVAGIRQGLTNRLADYMVPSYFVALEKFPLTANGKIDHKALHALRMTEGGQSSVVKRAYIAPETDSEFKLAEVWQSVLGIEKVGINDNFFELGGDSILTIQIVSRAKRCGIHITAKDIFDNQTIAQLSRVTGKPRHVIAEQGTVEGTLTLSPIHHWFFEQGLEVPNYWHQSVLIEVDHGVDTGLLEKACAALIKQHDGLNLSFRKADVGVVACHQNILDDTIFTTHQIASEDALVALTEELQEKCDIANGPVIHFALIEKTFPGEAIEQLLYVAAHHLVVDGVSWRILLDDLNDALNQLSVEGGVHLGEKTTSYQQYGELFKQRVSGGLFAEQIEYWQGVLEGDAFTLPVDHAQGSNRFADLARYEIQFDRETTDALLRSAHQAFGTETEELLLACLTRALCHWTGEDFVRLNLEHHGREIPVDEIDLTRTVGWFTSIYPQRFPNIEGEWSNHILTHKEILRNIPHHGLGFGALKYWSDENPFVEEGKEAPVLFNYLGQFSAQQQGSALFRLSEQPVAGNVAPQNQRRYELEINGGVSNGALRFTVNYSKARFHRATIENFARAFSSDVKACVSYCQSANHFGYSPSDFPLIDISKAQLDRCLEPIIKGHHRREVESVYPLTAMQKGMLFHSLYESNTGLYHEQIVIPLTGALQGDQLKQAWQETLAQHGILRTSFLWADQDQPWQVVYKSRPVDFEIITFNETVNDEVIQRYKNEDVANEFDLASQSLLRLKLLQFADQQFRLMISFHHIILDGWSLGLVFREAFTRYMALTQGSEVQLPRGPSYEKFIAHVESIDHSEVGAFWKEYLADFEQATELPRQGGGGKASEERVNVERQVDGQLARDIKSFAQKHGLTPNVLYQAAWSIVFSRLSGQKRVCYGVTLSGRPVEIDQIENTAGMFINTLPMFVEVDQQRLTPWLKEFQDAQQNLIKQELTPLADIQRYCHLKKQNLFECLFVFENFPVDEALSAGLPGLEIGELKAHWHTNFPLTVVVIPGDTLTLGISYDPGLFTEQYIAKVHGYYQTLLRDIVSNDTSTDEIGLDALCIISAQEQQLIVGDWNHTAADYPRDKTVAQLFEESVARFPEHIAVSHEGRQLSYLALNQQANQYAQYLSGQGVVRGEVVGLCVHRSIEMIVSILGVWKLGAAYMPLMASYPEERIDYMLRDAGVKRLIACGTYRSQLSTLPVALLDLEIPPNAFTEITPDYDAGSAEDVAHLLFTSGSTGEPKGIVVPHRGIVRLVVNNNFITLDTNTTFLLNAPISFDATSMEIWAPLLNGGRLVVAPEDQVEQGKLGELLQAEKVTSLFLTTALFHYQAEFSIESFAPLKELLVGGDVLSVGLAKKVRTTYPHLKFYHVYGPTENSCYTSFLELTDAKYFQRSVPIGRPIANTQVYVLDEHLRPVPVGTPGQLCTAGDGVALGYLNKPEVTAKAFVPNPFSEAYGHGAVLYKTGDLVRYLEDGTLEFIGRMDQQVKIRGFRIELGEIEKVLDQHEAIRQSAITAHTDASGIKRLVAYLVLDESQPVLARDVIRQYAMSHLPDYMVPSSFITLPKLPITANGKLDRKALPEPNFERKAVAASEPRNHVETVLCDVWQQVLGVANVGIYDNYFELGGDSILSIQVLSRAKRAGVLITAKQIFELQTIAELGRAAKEGVQVIAEQGLVTEEALITPIQQWYFDLPLVQPAHWNMSLLLKVVCPVEGEALARCVEQTVHAMIAQHDYLRSQFKALENQWQHTYLPLDDVMHREANVFEYLDLSDNKVAGEGHVAPRQESAEKTPWDAAIKEVAQAAQSSFDLNSGALFKVLLLKLSATEYRLLWVVHHLLIDGVSWRILLEDLQIGLTQSLAGQAVALGEKSTSFSQWTVAQQQFAQSDAVHQQLNYWCDLDARNVARLPLKDSAPHRVKDVKEVTIALSEQQTQQLLLEANKAYKTEINDLLLAALASAITQQCGHTRCLLHMEGHGREWVSDAVDVSRTVGWFTSLYPIVLSLPKDGSIGDDIKAVKQQLRQIPDKGFGYGLLKHFNKAAMFAEEFSSTDPFESLENSQISFNYLGQTDASFNDENILQLATEPAGPERDENEIQPYGLDVFAIVVQGRMQFGFRFGGNALAESFVDALAQQFETRLLAMLRHCLDSKHFGFVPADFKSIALNQSQIDGLCHRYPRVEDVYALSPLQHGMLFHALLDADSAVYFEQHCFDIQGALDAEKLVAAWHQVIQRHDILRSLFIPESAEHSAFQLVLKDVELPFSQLDLSEQESEQFLLEDRKAGFQFDLAPLMRVTLIDHGNGRQKLVWSFHHILLDGWSVSLVVGEVFQLYELSLRNESVEFGEAGRYKKYIHWLSEQPQQQAQEYWQHYLAGFTHPTVLGMKSSHCLNELDAVDNPIYDFQLDGALQAQLEQFSKKNRVTLNTVFQAAWGLLLSRYSNDADVVFGTTVSGRPADIADVEQMVGLFINTLPLRLKVDGEATALEWLQGVQEGQLQSRQFEYMPLFEINRLSEVNGDQRLFDSLLVFENYPVSEALKTDEVSVDIAAVDSVEQTNFPLTVIVMPGEQIAVRFSYDGRWFNPTLVARLGRQLDAVIRQLISPHVVLEEITLLDDAMRREVMGTWCTESLRPVFDGATVAEGVIQSVRRHPNEIAVRDEGSEISYGQLLQTAKFVSGRLNKAAVQPEDLVAVCLPRQAAMVPVLFGVHLAGAAYVPIDSSSPLQRIEAMLRDAAPKVCVLDRSMQVRLGPLLANLGIVAELVEDISEASTAQAGDALQPDPLEHYQPVQRLPDAHQLAYVIYTSGSTGQPKGVLIEHKGLKNLAEWTAQRFALNDDSVCTQMAGFGFDACVWEIWPCLLAGGTLQIISDEQRLDLTAMTSLMARQQVTHSFMPTPLAEAFIQLDHSQSSLRVLLTGGDQLTQWPSENLPFEVYNQYGPTESSVVATSGEVKACDAQQEAQGLPSIGKAIGNTTLYVLNDKLQPVGVGVAGELHIGGVGLARGYLNQPALTEAKFITCDSLLATPVRLYKSGDLVRFTDTGELEFLGRIDQQVKVRGFRIELGEIEAQMNQFDGVKECVVHAWDNDHGAKYLVAYIVPQGIDDFSTLVTTLQAFLGARLPNYMVPSVFTRMDRLPVTENGKVNRKALVKIELTDQLDSDYLAPRNDVESQLAAIWQQVLEQEKVGVNDDFFALGGHSILATKVHARMREEMSIDLPLKTLFEVTRISELAELIQSISSSLEVESVDSDDEDFEEGTL